MDALQVFHPERMADRILGMGDVVSLVERAQEQFDEEEARKLKKKLVKNQFNFNDFISQIQQIKKMGNLKDLASMLPGMGKMLKNVDIPDDVFKQTEAIISSMPDETVRRHAQDDEGRGRRRHEDAQDAGRDDAAIVLYKDRAGSKACLICLHADVSNSTLRKITEKSSPSPKENV